MSKEPYIPLTIDRAATKAAILAKERDLKRYAKRRKIATSTLIRILLDGKHAYPYQDARQSAFQRALRKMVTDGYLVEVCTEQLPAEDAQLMERRRLADRRGTIIDQPLDKAA